MIKIEKLQKEKIAFLLRCYILTNTGINGIYSLKAVIHSIAFLLLLKCDAILHHQQNTKQIIRK